jgi:hypothetical protein
MALPPQFKEKDGGGSPSSKPSVSAALSTLEDAAKSPRAHSALKTLRSELEEGNGGSERKPGSTSDAKAAALARMQG